MDSVESSEEGLDRGPRRPLRSWFEQPTAAERCLGLLADLIERAHRQKPSSWVLTVTERRTLSFTVGLRIVLVLSDGGPVQVAVDTTVLAPELVARLQRYKIKPPYVFPSAPEVTAFHLPVDDFDELLDALRPAMERALDRSAASVQSQTNFARFHQEGAVNLLAEATGRSLPQPVYPYASPNTATVSTDAVWSPAQIVRAWAVHRDERSDWSRRAIELVTEARHVDAATFATPAFQQKLWQARSFAGAGLGEAINVSSAYSDADLVQQLDALRSTVWPADPAALSSAIQQAFDRAFARLGALGLRARPVAKLMRIFSILLPDHLTCLLRKESRDAALRNLFPNAPAGGALAQQVQIRAYLREVLGPERDLDESATRITFCWSLQGKPPVLGADPLPPPPLPPVGADSGSTSASGARLVLWPFGRQYASLGAIKGYSNAWRDLLRAAQAGQTAEAIVEEARLGGVTGSESTKALRYSLSRLLGVGLIEREGDIYRPTAEGMRVLEGENEPLVECLLVRTYGLAQLLRYVARSPGINRDTLYAAMRAEYPSWGTNMAPSSLLAWTVDLGLTEIDAQRGVRLTDYGVTWHDQLPDKLPEPSDEATIDDAVTDEIPTTPGPSGGLAMPSVSEIQGYFATKIPTFVIEPETLAALHAGWTNSADKHFVILSGLSGTGKTAVLQNYAAAVCALKNLSLRDHFQVIPVSPDWHDPSGLLGYFNPLHADPTYQIEPALRLVLAAASDPTRPYFLVLDEMNLARVERYMAPFLSAMETRDVLSLHAATADVNGVPPRVRWPRNLFLAGTVNMDESTHPFSDKVLDRAFTLEFWDVDLERFFRGRSERDPETEATLLALHRALAPARRHFGYRTAGEVLDFVNAMKAGGARREVALDHAVFARVLPKLRGEESKTLRAALEAARELARASALPRCEAKLRWMLERLSDTGVTRFWS